jgi:repressor of nif and glnA expression
VPNEQVEIAIICSTSIDFALLLNHGLPVNWMIGQAGELPRKNLVELEES